MIRVLFKERLLERERKLGRRVPMAEVVADTKLSRATISRLANKPGHVTNTDVIDVLCTYFDCDPGDLLDRIPNTD